MAPKTEISLSKDGYFIYVLNVVEGKNRRYTIAPLDRKTKEPTDISNEPPEVKTACLKAWTPEVIEAYQTHLESAV